MSIDDRRTIYTLSLIAASFLLALLLSLIFSDVFTVWNYKINDRLFTLRHAIRGDEPLWEIRPGEPGIIHVSLDDESYSSLGERVKSRRLYAEVLNILERAGIGAVAFDIVFQNDTHSTHDDALVDAVRNAGNVYIPTVLKPLEPGADYRVELGSLLVPLGADNYYWNPVVVGGGGAPEATEAIATFPRLASIAKAVGHITVFPDKDGVFRRAPLVMKTGNGYVPSISLLMVAHYLRAPLSGIEISFGDYIKLADIDRRGKKTDLLIPINERGEVIVNFRSAWVGSFPFYPFHKLLLVEEDPDLIDILAEEIGGKLAIISDVSTSGRDIGPVPMESVYPLSGIHANIVNSMLTDNFLDETGKVHQSAIIFVLLLALALIGLVRGALFFSAATVSLLVLFFVFAILLLLYKNLFTNTVMPSLGIFLSILSVNAYRYAVEQREKEFMRRRLEEYFPPAVLKKILRSPSLISSNEKKVLTILFSDIAGFTTWSETQTPESIHSTLNEYFENMVDIVFRNEGTVDKYMGDGLMVFFGDPVEQPDHAARAVKTALQMQQKAGELRERWKSLGGLPLKIRIGINLGEVVVGNMGSMKRMDYTVLGANVNLAQRLESSAPPGGVVVSGRVWNEVKHLYGGEYMGILSAKGISEDIKVYRIFVPE